MAAAYHDRGHLYDSRKDHDRAIADFTKAIEINPKDTIAYCSRGNAYANKKDHDRAVVDYTKAIEIDPKYASASSNRGIAYRAKGELDQAIASASADLLRAIELGDEAYPLLFRFLAQERAGETATPELEANVACLKTKEWPYPVIELYLGLRSSEATLAAADKPGERCEAYFFIGESNILRGDRDEAAKALKVAARTCSKNWSAQATAELKRLNP